MPQLSDWVDEVRDKCLSGYNEEISFLSADTTSTDDTTFTLQYWSKAITPNMDINVGLELWHVVETVPSSNQITVKRGWRGTTKATHTTDDPLYIRTRYAPYRIVRELNYEIGAMSSSGLFGTSFDVITFDSSTPTIAIDPPDGFFDVLRLQRKSPNFENWSDVRGWELIQGLDAADYDSPYALRIEPASVATSDELLITYGINFQPLTSLTDDIEDVAGLSRSMWDIPPLGAAIRLVIPREIKRNQTESQGEPRRADEVPAGGVAQSARALQAQYDKRIASEKRVLNKQFPQLSARHNAGFMVPSFSGGRSVRTYT